MSILVDLDNIEDLHLNERKRGVSSKCVYAILHMRSQVLFLLPPAFATSFKEHGIDSTGGALPLPLVN